MIRSISSLKLYSVHLKPDEKTNEDTLIFVREGFSFLAFLFTILWALYYRLWWLASIIIIVNIGLIYGVNMVGLDSYALSIMQLGFQLWVGYHANDFLREGLRQRGFITAAIVSGENQSMAERRFLDRHSHLVTI